MSTSMPVGAVPGVETLEETAHASLFRRLLKNPTGVVSLAFLASGAAGRDLRPAGWCPTTRTAPRRWTSWPAAAARTGSARTAPATTSSRGCSSPPGRALRRALVALVVAAVIGITAGLVAGYYGRKWSRRVLLDGQRC